MLSTLLGILWFILKIILWILLGLLGLLLLLLLMVVFVPVRYTLEGSKYQELIAKGKVTYLLRLIRVSFEYDPLGYAYQVKVLFFTVKKETVRFNETDQESGVSEQGPSQTGSQPEAEAAPKLKAEPVSQKPVAEPPAPEMKPEPAELPDDAKIEDTKTEDKKTEDIKTPKTDQTTMEDKPRKKKKAKKQKTGEAESPLEQARRFWDFLREERNLGVLKFILNRVFKSIGSVLPKKFYGKVHFGLDDPAMTAYILGSASMLYHKYKDNLSLTADFENPVIEGEVQIKGRIIPGVFVWMAIRIYLDGRVRRLIKEVRK